LCGRELWSWRMGNLSFWLITAGITTMGLVLTFAGLQQGFQWMNGEEWVYSIIHMRPYWFVRTLSGVSMDVGMSLLVVNLMMTALSSASEASQPIPRGPSGRFGPIPAGGPAE
jgi:cytochrome c oxidase cbb3-type subunit 1